MRLSDVSGHRSFRMQVTYTIKSISIIYFKKNLSSHLTENTMHPHYKDLSANALLLTHVRSTLTVTIMRNIQIHCVDKKYNVVTVKACWYA
jgi:hypothetical protein